MISSPNAQFPRAGMSISVLTARKTDAKWAIGEIRITTSFGPGE
jgi:hypothetical protein